MSGGIVERANEKNVSSEIALVTKDEIKTILKKDGWVFNWKKEYANDQHQLYKLVISGETAIQGLLSLEPIKRQQFIEMHLIVGTP